MLTKGKTFRVFAVATIFLSVAAGFLFAGGQKGEKAASEVSIMYGTPWKEFIEPAVGTFEKETGIKVKGNSASGGKCRYQGRS